MSQRKEDKQKIQDALMQIEDLEKCIEDRIIDLYQIKGGMQARHAYCYYRNLIWDIRKTLQGK